MVKALVRMGALLLAGVFLIACRPGFLADPVVSAGDFQPFLEPEASYEPVLTALDEAKKSICMQMYSLTDNEIVEALKAAKSRGLDVRVLLESQPGGGGTGNQPAMTELRAAGIAVQNANPAYRLNHEKAIVVDDRVAFIMTLDMTRSGFTTNREFGIIDSDPDDVAEIVAVFEADWNRTVPSLSNPNLVWSPVNARQRITAFVDGARRTLDIEAETIEDENIQAGLMRAVQRGVAVRVIMSPSSSGPDANLAGQNAMAQGGVKLKLMKKPFIHAKMMVADGQFGFVGSQDFSPAALDFNRELGILLKDKRTVNGLQGTFVADWDIAR